MNSAHDKVKNLLDNGVGAKTIVIGSIVLEKDEVLKVEEWAVESRANFINNCGFQVYKHFLARAYQVLSH